MPNRTPPAPRRYWLVKSEPDVFSFDDLWSAAGRVTHWDGVRNYQARNYMRDEMKAGDLVLFYHSSAEPTTVVGVAEVVREAYPDHTAFDSGDPHFDPKSKPESPTWVMVDLQAVERFDHPVSLAELRDTPGLEGMVLLQKGSRLSVQPVRPEEWKVVYRLGRGRPAGEEGDPATRPAPGRTAVR
jgi:predicted RNA-binding protein with PUA-like domain